MDALSDVLRVIRLTGGIFLHAEFSAPWCISTELDKSVSGQLLNIERLAMDQESIRDPSS